jgi:hypothetical protein
MVPVMAELADAVALDELVPRDLHAPIRENFETAYARLAERDPRIADAVNERIRGYFADFELPEEPGIYDLLLLCLRRKDAIFTFNWDPFLSQARLRLERRGVSALPDMFFLHGNVAVGECIEHRTIGDLHTRCHTCGKDRTPTRLLYPIESKNYQDGTAIEGSWKTVQDGLAHAFWFTVFGYSAPQSDAEARRLLREGWSGQRDRPYEPIEIVDRPGRDPAELHTTWQEFIYRDHRFTPDDFFGSWMARHPRRTFEAYVRQYLCGEWIEENPVPRAIATLDELIEWFRPLLDAEDSIDAAESARVLTT